MGDKKWLRIGIWVLVAVGVAATLTIMISGILRLGQQQGPATPDQLFSLGQLVADTLVLPTALVIFVLELRRHTSEPDVDLYWVTGKDGLSKCLELAVPLEARQPTGPSATLVLGNNGDGIGIWYVLRLWVPNDLLGDRPAQDCWKPLTTALRAWNPAWLGKDGTEKQLLLTFRSEGRVAAYPGDELILGNLIFLLHRDVVHSRDYNLRYTICTNWGQKREGSLVVRLSDS